MSTEKYQWLLRARHDFVDWKPPHDLTDSAFAIRRSFFETHATHRNGNVVCPACGYPTLRYRNGYDCCSLCHWEDDGQDDPWADQPNGGPNDHSLTQARINFEETFSVWSQSEAEDFSERNQHRLFSSVAQREKKKLCELYDGLLTLETEPEINRQWHVIEEQCKLAP